MGRSIGRMCVIAMVLGLLGMQVAYPADDVQSFQAKVSASTTEYNALVGQYQAVMQKDVDAVSATELQELVAGFVGVRQKFKENLAVATPIADAMKLNRDKVGEQLKGVGNVLLKDRLEAIVKNVDAQIIALNTGVAVVESSLAEVDEYIGTLTVYGEALGMMVGSGMAVEVTGTRGQGEKQGPTAESTPEAVASSIPLTYVEGGTFLMGTTGWALDEHPMHTVTVNSFHMGTYEVTQDIYEVVMGGSGSKFKGTRLPVENVSLLDAVAFCNALSRRDGLEQVYVINGTTVTCDWSKRGYRLPTEAEWEYAARGGSKQIGFQYAGSTLIDAVAWYSGNSGKETHEVGTKKPNELGLFDMSGNVGEWCWDWYGNYGSAAQTNPSGPSSGASGADRVVRGGSWSTIDSGVRVASRNYAGPLDRRDERGFRVVVSADDGSGTATMQAVEEVFTVGKAGPAGGHVFYDKGFYSDGWRYLESAPTTTEWSTKGWGGYRTGVGGTGAGIGTGESNTVKIVAKLGSGDYAAKACADLVVTKDGVHYDDWFLPSRDELNQIFQVLKKNSIGGFSGGYYWSSSEYGDLNAWCQHFYDGTQLNAYRYNEIRVRPVRTF